MKNIEERTLLCIHDHAVNTAVDDNDKLAYIHRYVYSKHHWLVTSYVCTLYICIF